MARPCERAVPFTRDSRRHPFCKGELYIYMYIYIYIYIFHVSLSSARTWNIYEVKGLGFRGYGALGFRVKGSGGFSVFGQAVGSRL